MRDIEKDIREHWFPEHKAVLTDCGDMKVLQWSKAGTNTYMCRYVFDGNKMYISGDIGTAVFWLTWKAEIHSFNGIHVDYFEEKLDAYSGDRRNYNSKKAVSRLKEWKKQLGRKKYDKDMFQELIAGAESSSNKSQWAYEYVNGHCHDIVRELDQDYWEWIYDIGDEMPARIHGYLIGLKMASAQLSNE